MINTRKLELIHKTELQILIEIIRLCSINYIEYFVIGGTALGAVKYKGFIPWDDDIDIGMTRDNYNKFLKAAKTDLRDGLFLQVFSTDKESPFYYAKVRKNETKFIEYYCRNLNMNQGIFVDIFPLDNIPTNKYLRKIQYINTKILSNLYISKCVKELSSQSKSLKNDFKYSIRYILHFILKPISKQLLYKLLDKEFQKYNNKNTNIIGYIEHQHYRFQKELLYPLKKIQFESLVVNIPYDYHTYLTLVFGDYMKPPKKEKMYNHNAYIVEV